MAIEDNLPKMPTIDERNTKQLLQALEEWTKSPNILTLAEFRRYAPLYTDGTSKQNDPRENETLKTLAEELQLRLNFYRPTHVIRSAADPTVVLKLPQILVQLQTMSASDNNEKAVLGNYTHRWSDLPRIWSVAQNVMTQAFFREQASESQVQRIAEARTETKEIIDALSQLYAPPGATPATTAAVVETPPQLSSDDFEEL